MLENADREDGENTTRTHILEHIRHSQEPQCTKTTSASANLSALAETLRRSASVQIHN